MGNEVINTELSRNSINRRRRNEKFTVEIVEYLLWSWDNDLPLHTDGTINKDRGFRSIMDIGDGIKLSTIKYGSYLLRRIQGVEKMKGKRCTFYRLQKEPPNYKPPEPPYVRGP